MCTLKEDFFIFVGTLINFCKACFYFQQLLICLVLSMVKISHIKSSETVGNMIFLTSCEKFKLIEEK